MDVSSHPQNLSLPCITLTSPEMKFIGVYSNAGMAEVGRNWWETAQLCNKWWVKVRSTHQLCEIGKEKNKEEGKQGVQHMPLCTADGESIPVCHPALLWDIPDCFSHWKSFYWLIRFICCSPGHALSLSEDFNNIQTSSDIGNIREGRGL